MTINNSNQNYQLNSHDKNASNSLNKIASGNSLEITDASLEAISHQLGSQVSGMTQGLMNANDAVSMLQIADGTLQSLSEGTDKLNQLSIRMNSGLLNDSQKSALSKEFDAIGRTMQRSVDNASFNGKPLFGSDFDFSLGNSSTGTSLGSFDTSTLDINSQESIAAFSKVVQEQMIEVGSTTNALYSSSNSIIANISATAAAQSQMSDSDITKNVGDFSQADIMSKIAINAQTHQMDRLQSQMSVLVG